MEKYRNGRTTTARGSVPSHASLAIRRKPRLIVTTDQRGAPRIIKKTPTIGRCCARKRIPVKRNSRIDFGSFCIPPSPIPSIHPILEANRRIGTVSLEQYRSSVHQTKFAGRMDLGEGRMLHSSPLFGLSGAVCNREILRQLRGFVAGTHAPFHPHQQV